MVAPHGSINGGIRIPICHSPSSSLSRANGRKTYLELIQNPSIQSLFKEYNRSSTHLEAIEPFGSESFDSQAKITLVNENRTTIEFLLFSTIYFDFLNCKYNKPRGNT